MAAPFKHGQICFNELATSAPGKVMKFYGDVFGWKTKEVPAGPGNYTFFQKDGADIGGSRPQAPFEKLPNWVPYVWVDDVSAAIKKAESAGGKTLMPKTEVPGLGIMAFIADPAGAVFGIWNVPG